jgi:uncharacterized protein (DUF1778 family)
MTNPLTERVAALSAFLTPEEYELVYQAASQQGMTPQEFATAAVRAAAKQPLPARKSLPHFAHQRAMKCLNSRV